MADKKAEILEAAYELFTQKGYDATSIRNLCEATNLTSAGLYHYIKSKEELLNQVEEYSFTHFEALFSPGEPGESPKARVERFILEFTEAMLEHRGMFFILIAQIISATEGGAATESLQRRRVFVERVKRILEEAEGQAGGRKGIHPLVAVFSLIAMVNWVSIWFDPKGDISVEELASSLSTLFTKGFFEQ